MGQAHVKRWIDDLMPLVSGDRDPLGVAEREDGAIKIVLET
jgi:hypothetical protein